MEEFLIDGPCLPLLTQGFYAVYDTLFEKLVQQEVRFAEKSGKHLPEDLANAPRFGGFARDEPCAHAAWHSQGQRCIPTPLLCPMMLLADAWACWQVKSPSSAAAQCKYWARIME